MSLACCFLTRNNSRRGDNPQVSERKDEVVRTHTCGELTKLHIEKGISLAGWINKKRDHGNLLFIDLRDN